MASVATSPTRRTAKHEGPVEQLATTPPGWTPERWRERLLYLARVCVHAERSQQLQRAAAVIERRLKPRDNTRRDDGRQDLHEGR